MATDHFFRVFFGVGGGGVGRPLPEGGDVHARDGKPAEALLGRAHDGPSRDEDSHPEGCAPKGSEYTPNLAPYMFF